MTNNEYRDSLANDVLLSGESKTNLFVHLDQFEETFRPRTPFELFMIGEMTKNFWRKIRASCLEQIIFQQFMRDHAEMLPGRGDAANAAHACKTIALSPNAIDMVQRWHTRYQRLLRDNIRLFFEIRKELAANPGWEQSPPNPRASVYTSPLPSEEVCPEDDPTPIDPNKGAPESC